MSLIILYFRWLSEPEKTSGNVLMDMLSLLPQHKMLPSVLPRSTDVFNIYSHSIFLGDYPVPEMPSGNTLMDMVL